MTSYKEGPHFPDIFDHKGESEIAQKVYRVLAKLWEYNPEDLSSETKFQRDFDLDSVDYIDAMSFLEDGFKESELVMYLDDFEKMITISDLIKHIEGKVGETAAIS